MKKLFTILLAVLITAGVYSQAPAKISYQAVVRNAAGALIKTGNVGIKISILQASETGTAVYEETHTAAPNANGLVTLAIGGGTIVSGTVGEINWASGPYFIKTEVDPAGGTTYSISGTSELLSVPYALYAANSGLSESLKAIVGKLGILFDIDGNAYKTVKIGNQVWMAENLKVTHYRNGDPIISSLLGSEWKSQTEGAYNYLSDTTYFADYGLFYNGYAVMDPRNIAPEGWHIPSLAEWTTLVDYLGGETDCYLKLKETGTTHWLTNEGATNESGFTALPGGYIFEDGYGSEMGESGTWWTTNVTAGIFEWIKIKDAFAYRTGSPYLRGLSVRLVKD